MLTLDELAMVRGGADDFGRCGPGSSWKFLGNVYTPQCAAHDSAVRTAEAAGTPHWLAQVKALPLLPAAIGSYIKARL
jgi:hypothetical protein